MSGGERQADENRKPKKISKTFEKPLDKHHEMWYNISVVRERYRPPTKQIFL